MTKRTVGKATGSTEPELPALDKHILSSDSDHEDMGEMFREWDEAKKQRKRDRFQRFEDTNELEELKSKTGKEIIQKDKYHYHILDVGGFLINWWPSSNKWQWQKTGKVYQGGFKALVGFIRNRSNPSTAEDFRSRQQKRKEHRHGKQRTSQGTQIQPDEHQRMPRASDRDHAQACEDDGEAPF